MTALHKYRITANMAAKSYMGDSPHFLLTSLLRLIRVAILLSLWRVLLKNIPIVNGMTLPALLTYTLIAEVFAEQMTARTGIEDLIWSGTITTRFLQPLPLAGIVTAEMWGRWRVGFWTVTVPLLLLSPLLGISPLPAQGVLGGLLFLLSLALAVVVGLALDTIFAAILIVWGGNVWILADLRNAVATLLTGAFLPYALMPFGLGEVFAWLPFAAMASAPLQIFTGTGNSVQLLGMQVFWAIVLIMTAAKVWEFSRERIVGQGG